MFLKFFRLSKEEMVNNQLAFIDRVNLELHRAAEAKIQFEIEADRILLSHENSQLQDLFNQQKRIEARIKEDYEEIKKFEKPPTELYRSYLDKVEKQLPPIRYQIRQIQEKHKVSKRLNEAREKAWLANKEIGFIEHFLSKRQNANAEAA